LSGLLRDKRRLLVIGLIALIAVLAALAAFHHPGGGGTTSTNPSGGGGPTTTSPSTNQPGGSNNTSTSTPSQPPSTPITTTSTPPPGSTLYPTGDIVNGFNVIFLEDHVEVEGDHYKVVSNTPSLTSLVAYGGSSVTGNITYGSAYIKTGYYTIPVIGFASTNATIKQDFPGMQIRLTADGGYVLYTPVSMAIYYRRYEFNISNTIIYVWVPAKTLPSTLATGATQHVYIDPETATYYVNGQAYKLIVDMPQTKVYKGVLRSWVISANRYGVFVFQINP
jgi:hypothetical protein